MLYDPNSVLQRVAGPGNGGNSPDSIGFSANDGGRKTATFVVSTEVLNEFCVDLMGNANLWPQQAESGIVRNLPAADSQFPFLYVDSISNIVQYQYVQAQDWEYKNLGQNQALEAPQIPNVYPEYNECQVSVNYSPRNYVIASDEWILAQRKSFTYYPRDPAAAPTLISNYMPEYLRYTFISELPRTEFLAASIGQSIYYAPGLADINNLPAGTGQIKSLYSSSVVKVKWNQIPYSFVTGQNVPAAYSYKTAISYCLGTVNQWEFLGYPAGTLLFEAVTVDKIYPQPFQPYVKSPYTNKYLPENFLLCDVEFSFVYRNPPPGDNYAIFGGINPVQDKNRIYAGHNLVPRAQSGTYLANIFNGSWDPVAKAPSPNSYPTLTYYSAPHEILFMDPQWIIPRLPQEP